MSFIEDFLKNNAVLIGWIVLIALIAFNVGAALGIWTPDNSTWASVDGVLVMLGFTSIRGQYANAAAGLVDLGATGQWLAGHKTNITAIIGGVYNLVMLVDPTLAGSKWVIAANIVFSAFGFAFLGAASGNLNSAKLKAVAAGALKLVPVVLLFLLFTGEVEAQEGAWSYFLHPRPPGPVATMQMRFGADNAANVTTAPPMWLFLPSVSVIATDVRFFPGQPTQFVAFSAAGPGVTYAHSTQVNGINHTDWSITGALLVAADTKVFPNFHPGASLMVGILDGAVNLGPKYEFTKRDDGGNQLSVLVAWAWLPTLN